jgi:uncharacterized protein (TIRG00374 family)
VSTIFKLLAAASGLALLAWIAGDTDLAAVGQAVLRIGWDGAVVIILLFAAGFTLDVGAWAFMFASLPVTWLWAKRLWLVQMVGEAANVLLPLGSLGGEPVKALLLKKHYDVSYREGTASLLLIQSINTLAEVPFVVVGLAAMLHRGILPSAVEWFMIGSVALLVNFTVWLFVAIHLRWLVTLQKRLARSRWGARLNQGLDAMGDIEQRLYTFIRHRPAKFTAALVCAFLNWTFGAIEMFFILKFLGAPVSFTDAWLLETCVVLVRNATFFIPGHLGSQDGIIALVAGALTGSPAIGLAVALIRRARELLWSGAGLGIGGWFGLKSALAESTK